MIILRIRKKERNINIKHGMDIMRVTSSSVVEAKQDADGELTVPKETGSNDAAKDAYSSHNGPI